MVIKVVFIGDKATGKTKLCQYCIDPSQMPNLSPEAYKTTIGVDFAYIREIGPKRDESIVIWDLMPYTEHQAPQVTSAWSSANLLFLCVDITRTETFAWAQAWLQNRPAELPTDVSIYLVATKHDRAFERSVTVDQLTSLQETQQLAGIYQTDASDSESLTAFRANVINNAELILNPPTGQDLQENEQCQSYLATMVAELRDIIIPYKKGKKVEAEENANNGLFNKKAADFDLEIKGLEALQQALEQLVINHHTFSQDIKATIERISTGEHKQAFVKNGVALGWNTLRRKSQAQDFCERLAAGAANCGVAATATTTTTAASTQADPAAPPAGTGCCVQ